MPTNVFKDLTGAPSYTYVTKTEEMARLWSKVATAANNKWLLAASCSSEDLSKSQLEKLGLVADHAYSILHALEVKDSAGRKVRLV
mmetsp:Transcript_30244/g.21988  ORF Transcript_30244/g.21988 Transcript_30244/m.21988 type:complete len:86 (-) Transcript_30244:1300-1557(-)